MWTVRICAVLVVLMTAFDGSAHAISFVMGPDWFWDHYFPFIWLTKFATDTLYLPYDELWAIYYGLATVFGLVVVFGVFRKAMWIYVRVRPDHGRMEYHPTNTPVQL